LNLYSQEIKQIYIYTNQGKILVLLWRIPKSFILVIANTIKGDINAPIPIKQKKKGQRLEQAITQFK